MALYAKRQANVFRSSDDVNAVSGHKTVNINDLLRCEIMFDYETPCSCRYNSFLIHGLPIWYTVHATYRNQKTKPVPGLVRSQAPCARAVQLDHADEIQHSDDHNAGPYDTRISLIMYTLSTTSKLNHLAHNINIPQVFIHKKYTCRTAEHTSSERTLARECSADLFVGREPLMASFRSEITEHGLESGG